MSEKTILVWFRNDLRIHDNEILLEAVRKADKILPVYCFDPYYFKKNPSGNSKTGNLRVRFLLESVADLRKNLQALGGDLIIRVGNPAEVLTQLAEEYQVNRGLSSPGGRPRRNQDFGGRGSGAMEDQAKLKAFYWPYPVP